MSQIKIDWTRPLHHAEIVIRSEASHKLRELLAVLESGENLADLHDAVQDVRDYGEFVFGKLDALLTEGQ